MPRSEKYPVQLHAKISNEQKVMWLAAVKKLKAATGKSWSLSKLVRNATEAFVQVILSNDFDVENIRH